MLRFFFVIASLVSFNFAHAETNRTNLRSQHIIPLPVSQEIGYGEFAINAKTRIFADDENALQNAKLLNQAIFSLQGFALPVKLGRPARHLKNIIIFQAFSPEKSRSWQENESYRLAVSPLIIAISGSAQGQFYGLQSLLQLLPTKRKEKIIIESMQIEDQPRFAWRGLHLDVGRHLFPVDFIKKLLDQMAVYKLNTFHWHLTEDQGWRIEIKRYPKLTQIGAYRKETTKDRNYEPYIGDGEPYGGFYTQDQIKEVIAYAQARHIMVVPEIELPGHSQAALAAYPELACTEGPFEVATNWGVFEDIYCPSEKTFTFLENVLTEVIALFPAPYIHIGGDEAPKTRWKTSSLAQDVMKREGLKNEEELQSYFIRRIEKLINNRGKRLIGWDEILEGGLAPNATVMSWRGEEGGIAAAKQGHDVIMTPTSWCYFDAGQGPKEQEMWNLGGEIPIEKVYSYDPVPKELDKTQQGFIRGVQANVWTEYLRTPEKVEYMVFPRLLAMAEVAWTAQNKREFNNFEQRLGLHYSRLQQAGIGYRIPRPKGLDTMVINGEQAVLELVPPVANSEMYVSLDGSNPTTDSLLYKAPIHILFQDKESITINVLTVLADGRESAVQKVLVKKKKK